MSTHTGNERPPLSTAAHALALHVGFAGARDLGFKGLSTEVAEARFAALVAKLAETLGGLNQHLGLHSGYFSVGLSQVAVGADSVFADACARAGVLQRVLLPQPRDGFLNGTGSTGPDFDEAQKQAAIARLDAAHVIQEWVVSNSADRHTRFRECSFEILRLSDVVLTLQPTGAETGGRPGGTNEFLAAARRHRKVILECQFSFTSEGELDWSVRQSVPDHHVYPQLPALFDQPLPRGNFIALLKQRASARADQLKRQFEARMQIVIRAHVVATGIAAAALALSYAMPDKTIILATVVGLLLLIELFLLIFGWLTHQRLHQDQNTIDWATARLTAEAARSAHTLGPGDDKLAVANNPEHATTAVHRLEAQGMSKFFGDIIGRLFKRQATVHSEVETKTVRFAGQHTHLKALFDLPMPEDFRALTRTLNVLHLEATRPNKAADWRELRDRYIRERLDTTLTKNRGQIPYFDQELSLAEQVVRRAHRLFNMFVGIAVAATAVKLALSMFAIKLSVLAATLSWLAIFMPVLAVAVMSISANLDKDARASTYRDVKKFLERQRDLLEAAETEPEFLRLQTECEVKLLSEALHWYYRRRFANPA